MVKFKLIERKNPRQPGDPSRYYAIGVNQGKVDIRELADQISEKSTVTSIDTIAVIEALLKVIPRELANGRIVTLGDLGTLRLTLKSEGSDQPEKFSATMIKGTKLHFRPGKEVRKVLNNISYAKTKAEQSLP
ncbi:MAG: HU family DNA-binding protein [Bacteroidales bacterium]|nr:HU family DNA-binding protein [Bacteroidales bacterium]